MLDKDLRSIQEARQLARAAQEAHEAFSGFSEQAIDKILQAMVEVIVKNAERLARMTVDPAIRHRCHQQPMRQRPPRPRYLR